MNLPHRILVLVSLIQELQNFLTEENIHKYLFLYCHKYACNNSYDFILCNDQPYCITIYEDKKFLINKNILQGSSYWLTHSDVPRFAKKLDMIEKLSLQKLKNDAERNLIADEVISSLYDSYFKVVSVNNEQMIFYTIGYEGLSLEQYLNKLQKYQVKCLCDVRRNPYSQKYGFSKTEMIQALSMVSINYLHLPELGVASSLRQDLKNDTDYYNLLKQYEIDILPKQQDGINLLHNLLVQYKRIAITCFEAKLSNCHRSKIANLMSKNSLDQYMVKHI